MRIELDRLYSGVNIQYPISGLILSGQKSIETRTYPLPSKYLGVDILLVETPGRHGRFKSRAVAIIQFDHCFQYRSKKEFYADVARHHITPESPWAWMDESPKWGWHISKLVKVEPKKIDQRLGIRFTLNISIN